MTEYLRNIDVFSKEPVSFHFGDPKNKKTSNMWKTSFGGCTTIVFGVILAAYIVASFISLESGDQNTIEETTLEN